jgi:hypothetical protein
MAARRIGVSKSNRLVIVTWLDSCLHEGWGAYDPTSGLSTCHTSGFLMRKTRQEVAVAQSISNDGNIDALMVIPRGCIKRIRYLR